MQLPLFAFAIFGVLTAGAAIPKDRIVAHRGASVHCPENTLAAYGAARDAGFAFECDLHLSTDGYVFMNHDWSAESVFAKTGINKHATNLTWKGELEFASAGAWAGERWKDEKYPLLDDVFAMAPKGRLTYYDVKIGSPAMAHAIVAALKRHPEVKGSDCMFLLGPDARIAIIRAQLPDAKFSYCTIGRRGWNPDSEPIPVGEMIAVLKKWGFSQLGVMWDPELITADYVRKLHEAGFAINVWTINDRRAAEEAFARGVDSVTSDDPERLLEENPEPRVAVPTTAAPTLDGAIGADEWRDAVRMEGFCVYRRAEMLPADASFMIKQDGQTVYVAGRCIAPKDGLVRKVMARAGNADAFADDCYEFVFIDDVHADAPCASHLIVNFNGAMLSRRMKKGQHVGWKAWETVVAKSTMKDGYWEIEVAVPFAEVGFTKRNAKRHAIRICRDWWKADDSDYAVQTSWTQNDGPFLAVSRAPRVEFRDDAPVIRCERLGPDAGGASYEAVYSVFNPGREDQWIDARLRGQPVNSQPGERREVFRVAPGERREFALKAPVLNDEAVAFEASFLKATVTAFDGWVAWHARRFTFAPNAPRVKFRPKGAAGEASFKFAYYPSYNRARIAADVANCRGREKVTALALSVRDAEGKELARVPLGKGPAVDRIVDLPDLAAETRRTGREDYEAVLVAEGASEIKASLKFKRGVFAWEGNKLGLSDAIPEPFEKVKRERVQGKSEDTVGADHRAARGQVGADHRAAREELEKVTVVLREHIVETKTGLWRQVTAAGKELLARPMRLVAAGRPVVGPYQAAGRPVVGPYLAESVEWDVDGMMRWDLTLKPGHYEPMTLEIPLRAERAKLYHACADGMRFNDAGEVPAGQGVVWDSSKAPRTSIVGDYIPYLWVGGPLRGIAVFGENDRGWVIRSARDSRAQDGAGRAREVTSTTGIVPCQEIVREADGTVVIRLNLIQRPVDVTEPRLIRLAFQATPVKPMEKNFRASPIGDLVGSCYYWGGAVASDAIAPFDGTDEYLRKMGEARRTGKVDHEYVDRCIKTVTDWKKGTKAYDSYLKCMKAHFNAGHNVAAGAGLKGRLTFYTNGRGVELGIPSGLTFCDEWERNEFTNRDQLRSRFATVSYGLDPQPSYLDYAAWWWKKMLESGACDYLYWDDVFCTALFDPVGTDAYRLPDGTIQPGTGIFNMRACVRRCAVLQAEMGRTCWKNWVHMTNTALAPVLAFAGTNYDWEDVAGDTSLQERYSRASIQAQSLGRQFGNRVAVMGYFATRDKEKLKKLHRWGTGAVIAHEIQWHRVPEWREANKKLEEWGYRLPTTQVWNYWDEDVPFPVRITGGESAALAMAKPVGGAATVGADHRAARANEALIVVSDWDKGGDYAVRPDVAALGLKPGFRAYDLETGRDLKVVDGAVRVTLSKLDYVMIALRP